MRSVRLFSSFMAVAAAVALAIASTTYDKFIVPAGAAWRMAKKVFAHGFELAAAKPTATPRTFVFLVQAKAFVRRLYQRSRPELTGSWRMCASV